MTEGDDQHKVTGPPLILHLTLETVMYRTQSLPIIAQLIRKPFSLLIGIAIEIEIEACEIVVDSGAGGAVSQQRGLSHDNFWERVGARYV